MVVGAGLAGSLMSIYLAERGFDVRVFERRPDLRRTAGSAGRSINLALSTRGLTALRGVGLDQAALEISLPMRERMMHGADGTITRQPYSARGECIYSISRRGLNELLLNRAESHENVSFHFEHACRGGDLAQSRVDFRQAGGDGVSHSADLVVGADGAFSALRAQMMRTDRFEYAQSYLSYGYKELTMPPTADGGFALDPGALHIWPRHEFMMIALPNPDCTFTCTLFLPFDPASSAGGVASCFDGLDTDANRLTFFERAFPDALPLIPQLLDEWSANPTGSLVTIRCAPYAHPPSTVLIGDAAHAVVPFYGQGMNAAFEDCTVLGAILDEHGTADIPGAISRFARERKPDADAIADLAIDNFVEMRSRVADEAFLQRKVLEACLTRAFPEHYRSLYEYVTFSGVPYAEARRRARANMALLDERPDAVLGLLSLAWMRTICGASGYD